MNLRLHERARHADVRQAPGPDLGLRHEADSHVRRLPSPPSVFHDNPGMARPGGDAPLRSMLPPFHATAVTLSSRSGDRLSSIGTPSPASGASVGPCCAAFAPRAEDGAAVGPRSRAMAVGLAALVSPSCESTCCASQKRMASRLVHCSSAQFAGPCRRAT
jgi:hypothetical protein